MSEQGRKQEHRSHHGSHGHHGHHRSHRTREQKRKEKLTNALTIVLVAVVVAALGLMIIQGLRGRNVNTSADKVSTTGAYRHITVDGKNYAYNERIKSVLYIGIDSEGVIEPGTAYGSAPRSDVVMLMVMDEYQKKLSVISFNRNTMTEMRQYDVSGNRPNSAEKQLAYAFADGEGGKKSAETTMDAISNLLGGIPVDRYVVMNRSSIPYINELLGGVTITLPDDSLADRFPDLKKGATVTLTDEQAEAFVRYRESDKAFSNNDRMERQKVFLLACIDKMQDSLLADAQGTWNKVSKGAIADYVMTNVTENQYLTYVNVLGNLDLSEPNFYIPEGEDDDSEELEKHYINEDSLTKILLDIFYLEE